MIMASHREGLEVDPSVLELFLQFLVPCKDEGHVSFADRNKDFGWQKLLAL